MNDIMLNSQIVWLWLRRNWMKACHGVSTVEIAHAAIHFFFSPNVRFFFLFATVFYIKNKLISVKFIYDSCVCNKNVVIYLPTDF